MNQTWRLRWLRAKQVPLRVLFAILRFLGLPRPERLRRKQYQLLMAEIHFMFYMNETSK